MNIYEVVTSFFDNGKVSGRIEEIDVYYRENGMTYRTTADNNPAIRQEIINAFNELY